MKAGLKKLTINGVTYPTQGSFELQVSHDKKEPIIGNGGLVGHKIEPVAGSIKGDLIIEDETKIKNILDVDGATIMAETRNGKIFILSDATHTGDGNFNTEDNKLPVEFTGKKGEWS